MKVGMNTVIQPAPVPEDAVAALIRANRDADLLRFTTAGSVDDGKSTLIGRLLYDSKAIYDDQLAAVQKDSRKLNREEVDLALLTDGLKSEREQGITIDVAYRYFSTPKRRFIIADTPGHIQYTRNMATGASTANLAIILIDARNGVLTQSRRHGFIASLFGIPHILVAINKMDLVDYSEAVYDRIREDYANFAAKLGFRDLAFIPISALRGDNVVHPSLHMPWYKGVSLITHLETVHIGGDRNLIDLRFPVQYVSRPNLDFRGYCGTVASGVLRVGDAIMALPSGKKTRVKSIVTFDGSLNHAFPPQSVTVCLEDEIDIGRGDVLVHPRNQPHVAREVEAMLVWMDETPLELGKAYAIKHLTQTVRGTFAELVYRVDPDELHRQKATSLALNEVGRVTLELFRPIMCDEYARNRTTGSFIVIDPASNRTAGAGMIIERTSRRPVAAHADAAAASHNLKTESSLVPPPAREQLLLQRPATLWLTGPSGSGEATLARQLELRLLAAGHPCYVLDADTLEQGLNRDLGASPDDRAETIRRAAEVARLFNEAGLIVITAFLSPYRADRDQARRIIGSTRFLEVFVDASRADAGAGSIGLSTPYEPPENPDLVLPTGTLPVEESVTRLLAELTQRGFLPSRQPDRQSTPIDPTPPGCS